MIDLVFYSIVEVATGFAPNFTMFLILRALSASAWAASGAWALRSPWRKCPLSGAAYCPVYCSKVMRWEIFLPHSVISFFSITGAGARCSFWAACPRCSLCSFVFGVKESEVWEKSKSESWSGIGRSIARPLETVSLPGAADGWHEFRLAWHPGHVSHVPAALLAFGNAAARSDFGHLDGRRHYGRRAGRSAFSTASAGGAPWSSRC